MFQKELLEWFDINKREMPWRESYAPYHIWISEIMLQQTQVITVIPYFKRFIKKYPNIESLAYGNEEDVMKLWEGLGYYSRARRLIACARQVVEQYDGKIPEDYHTLLKLPGIGPYTAGAIMSIAYNKPFAAVDGNVKRVFSRYYNIQLEINEPKHHKVFNQMASDVLPDDPRNFNQALMELGALICKPSSPQCDSCPIRKNCEAYHNDLQHLLPLYKKKPEKQKKFYGVALIQCDDALLIEYRADETLLGQMWGLPSVAMEEDAYSEKVVAEYLQSYNVFYPELTYMGKVKHVFTHQVWEMGVFYGCMTSKERDLFKGKWHDINKLDEITVATGYRKVLKLLEARHK